MAAVEGSLTESAATACNSIHLSMDFNHPLYLHPSDTSSTMLISQVFTGAKNYTI